MAAKARFIKGAWWVVVHHQDQRRLKRIGKSKSLALRVAEQIQARLVLGEFQMSEESEHGIPFGEFADQWFRREILLPQNRKARATLAGGPASGLGGGIMSVGKSSSFASSMPGEPISFGRPQFGWLQTAARCVSRNFAPYPTRRTGRWPSASIANRPTALRAPESVEEEGERTGLRARLRDQHRQLVAAELSFSSDNVL